MKEIKQEREGERERELHRHFYHHPSLLRLPLPPSICLTCLHLSFTSTRLLSPVKKADRESKEGFRNSNQARGKGGLALCPMKKWDCRKYDGRFWWAMRNGKSCLYASNGEKGWAGISHRGSLPRTFLCLADSVAVGDGDRVRCKPEHFCLVNNAARNLLCYILSC